MKIEPFGVDYYFDLCPNFKISKFVRKKYRKCNYMPLNPTLKTSPNVLLAV